MMDDEEVQRRLPLWCALAELFLDTEMQPVAYEAVARAAREAGYTAVEVHDILRNEMWPAFSFNLLDIAGEWAGFSSDYVLTRMLEMGTEAGRWPIGGHPLRDRFMRLEWPLIEAALEGRVFQIPATTPKSDGRPRGVLLTAICLAAIVVGLILVFRV